MTAGEERSVPTLDVGLVRSLVAAQFPEWAPLTVRPVPHSGWDNRTFRLGDELLVRLPSAAPYAAQVAKEQHFLPLLAGLLPVPIPEPVAQGAPGSGYPFDWSVYRWLPGEPAATAAIPDLGRFAVDVGTFLRTLHTVDLDGPPPGEHNFFRGAHIEVYAEEALSALAEVRHEVPEERIRALLDAAMRSRWSGTPGWVHGDVAEGNLLVRRGRLAAVIDFGSSAVGDPACDTVLAWTLLSGLSRDAFRRVLRLDEGTWARGRAWALWKSLITLRDQRAGALAEQARRTIAAVLTDEE